MGKAFSTQPPALSRNSCRTPKAIALVRKTHQAEAGAAAVRMTARIGSLSAYTCQSAILPFLMTARNAAGVFQKFSLLFFVAPLRPASEESDHPPPAAPASAGSARRPASPAAVRRGGT